MSHEHLSAKRGVIDLCTGLGGNHVKLVFAEMARCRLTYQESHTAWARSRPYLRRVSTNVANNMPGHFHITDLLSLICDRVKVVPTHHIHRHPEARHPDNSESDRAYDHRRMLRRKCSRYRMSIDPSCVNSRRAGMRCSRKNAGAHRAGEARP